MLTNLTEPQTRASATEAQTSPLGDASVADITQTSPLSDDGVEDETGLELTAANSTAVGSSAITKKSVRATIGGDKPENFTLLGVKPLSYLPWCSSIVLSADGTWIELRCCECGGNTSPSTSGLMRGVGAMHGHLRFSHDYEPMKMPEVIDRCAHRVVEEDEVGDIVLRGDAGMPYVDMIPAETKTTQRTKSRSTGTPLNLGKGLGRSDYTDVPWSFAREKRNYVYSHSCVVKHPDGTWYEIACPVCNGNSPDTDRSGYLKGAKAFYDHIRQGHEEIGLPGGPAKTIERCQVRQLSDREVDKLRRSAEDAPVIKAVKVQRFPSENARNPFDAAARASQTLQTDLTGTRKRSGVPRITHDENYGRNKRGCAGSAYYDDRDEDDEEPAPNFKTTKRLKASSRPPIFEEESEDEGEMAKDEAGDD